MSRESLFQYTEFALEWPPLLELLASQAHSSLGADYCRSLPLAESCSSAEIRIHETSEMIALSEGTLPFPVLNFHDTDGALIRAEKGAVLDPQELRRMANAMALILSIQRCLHAQKDLVPYIYSYIEHLSDLSVLRSEIDECISPEGEVLDHASSALYDAIKVKQQEGENFKCFQGFPAIKSV